MRSRCPGFNYPALTRGSELLSGAFLRSNQYSSNCLSRQSRFYGFSIDLRGLLPTTNAGRWLSRVIVRARGRSQALAREPRARVLGSARPSGQPASSSAPVAARRSGKRSCMLRTYVRSVPAAGGCASRERATDQILVQPMRTTTKACERMIRSFRSDRPVRVMCDASLVAEVGRKTHGSGRRRPVRASGSATGKRGEPPPRTEPPPLLRRGRYSVQVRYRT